MEIIMKISKGDRGYIEAKKKRSILLRKSPTINTVIPIKAVISV